MSRIFISYSRVDEPFARKIARSLSDMGAQVWLDVEDIPAGMKWSTAIQQGLNVCQIMLLIVSPESMASNNVEDEWQYFLDNKKPIIPILFRPAEKHFQINRLQHVDFHNGSYQTAFERLMRELSAKGLPLANSMDLPQPRPQQPVATSPRIEFTTAPPPKPAEPAAGTRMTDDKGVEMVYVPAGKFMMGSDENDDEKPIHEVQITTPFWLDLTPVTNESYARFINDGGYKNSTWWTKAGWVWVQVQKVTEPENYEGFNDPLQPRVGISWYESLAYGAWRGGRLSTEAEWEWAARGSQNRLYPWGDTFDAKHIIFNENSSRKTAVVGSGIRQSGASWVGALDMSGNVWEWCSSLYQSYPYHADDGRENLDDEGSRIVRAGRGASFKSVRVLRIATTTILSPVTITAVFGLCVPLLFESLFAVGVVLRQQQARPTGLLHL